MHRLFFISAVLLCWKMGSTVQAQPGAYQHDQRNVVKVHLSPVLLNNYGIQYERMLGPQLSLAINGRYMPEGPLPMRQSLMKHLLGDFVSLVEPDNIRVGGSGLSSELRFYLGSPSGARGFYLAPYATFSSYQAYLNQYAYPAIDDHEQSTTQYVDVNMDVKGVTGGLMIGIQWHLGARLSLDWWIVGASYGRGWGELQAITHQTLDTSSQESLKNEMENLDIPLLNIEAHVHPQGLQAQLRGPWAGLKGGLSLGLRF